MASFDMRAATLGAEMCKALGIDPEDVIGITVTCRVDDVATVIVERIVTWGELGEVKQVFERYNLVEAKGECP